MKRLEVILALGAAGAILALALALAGASADWLPQWELTALCAATMAALAVAAFARAAQRRKAPSGRRRGSRRGHASELDFAEFALTWRGDSAEQPPPVAIATVVRNPRRRQVEELVGGAVRVIGAGAAGESRGWPDLRERGALSAPRRSPKARLHAIDADYLAIY